MGTVLLVDDNADTRNVMSRMLVRSGNRVIPASTVAAAEQELEQETPDLILTDLMMPDESGVDLIRHVRADERFDDVPIIVLSAVSERRYVDEAMDAGATDYWLKGSVHARDFARKLQPYLPGETGWADAWLHVLEER